MQKINKTALITGGARGIGESLTKIFAKNGYDVVIHCGKSVENAQKLCAQYENAKYFCSDLSSADGVRALAEFCPDPDVLVNNAGIALVAPFDSVTDEQAKKLYMTDLYAPIELSRLIAPAMIKRKSGSIINISSVFGEHGGSCEVDYSAAKAGLIGFTKALAKELGPSGIRVNCVCPGLIDTEMNDDLSFEDVEALTADIPLCRMGSADEVAAAVFYLADDSNAGYITGSVIDVNGGWM